MADDKPQAAAPEAQPPTETKPEPESQSAPEAPAATAAATTTEEPTPAVDESAKPPANAAPVLESTEPKPEASQDPLPAAAAAPVPTATETNVEASKEEAKPEAEATKGEAVPEPKVDAEKKEEKSAEESTADGAAAAPAEAPKEKEEDASSAPIQQLWAAVDAHAHDEIWGVVLADPATHIPSQIVLQKYLNANDGNLAKAKDQLIKTLDWRAEAKPLELVKKTFSKNKFDGLGYVTDYTASETETDPEKREVFTWNIYGAASKRLNETFGDLNEFIEWRVALMELALPALRLNEATTPITAEHDPYKLYQVHDYQSISFLRQAPEVKAASTKTISVFAQNYPELLKEKFFVNVPAIMGFMYNFFKLFVAAKTAKKFHPMTYGAGLAKEMSTSKVEGIADKLPQAYGGKGGELSSQGKQTLLADAAEKEQA